MLGPDPMRGNVSVFGDMTPPEGEIWRVIDVVRKAGVATIIVDKTVDAVLSIGDRVVVLVKGAAVHDGPPASLRADTDLMSRYLGVAG
jgi:branched-chain amino acid transport system ATP-binding protein